ncbi:MAG: hypothetical protein KAS66_05450 [Candidatus Omnitrophica bacterium]|nr:hypothetical protein [Candidatus Omnitrophota bacterium]
MEIKQEFFNDLPPLAIMELANGWVVDVDGVSIYYETKAKAEDAARKNMTMRINNRLTLLFR